MTDNRPMARYAFPIDAYASMRDVPTPVSGVNTRRIPMSNIYTVPTVADYVAADRAGKSNMRATASAAMLAAIDRMDIDAASVIRTRMTEWTESNTRSTVVVDYVALVADRVATLRAAADMIESGAVRPSGIADDVTIDASVVGTVDVDRASRIAGESIKRSEKSDMRGAIASIVDGMTVGTFYTVADVASMVGTTSDYVGRTVSHGAVRNALESNKVPNVVFVPSTSSSVNGCRRTA